MVGLNASLSIASQALAADSGALEITNNNIENANTVGYTRQVVTLSAQALVQGSSVQDAGVSYDGFSSVRDELLQIGINQKTSDSASLSAQSASYAQLQTSFSSTTSGVGAALSIFFNDLSNTSTQPTDSASRQSVLADAGQLTTAFHQASSALATTKSNADSQVVSTISQINQLSSQIASLNAQLSTLPTGQDGGSIQDQRDQLTTQLAGLTGISVVNTGSAPTITTTDGSPLVMGTQSYSLQVSQASDGTHRVLNAQGQDITTKLSSGTLGGAITTRDTTVPALSSKLDDLASQFASSINAAQTSGRDQNGATGQPLFSLPTDGSSAAAGISVALTSTSSLALSSDGSAGSSGNVANFMAVQTTQLASGDTPSNAYASLVYSVGSGGSTVNSSLTATQASLSQLTTQQASTEGVSVDEETTNLIRYQNAYTAAARVISTINDLFTTLMNIPVGS